MTGPTHAATLLIGAMLSACAFGGFDLAAAGAIATSSDTAASMPHMRSATPATAAPAIFAETAAPAATPPAAGQPAIEPRGRVYLFRGALGPIFSRGMDHLTERIEQAGFAASVYEFTICRFIAAKAIREYRQDPAPIILIGHSMGGLCALTLAEILQAEDISVSLIVTVDPAQASPSVPLNVERYINVFLSKSVLGGGDVVPKQGYQGHYASFDLSEHEEVSHINIDKMDSIHEQIITKIVQLATLPGKAAAGEAVPLHYVVPPDAAIELWDSGMPILARPGDTLQKLAALHRVPLWSLTQINPGSDGAPLVPGQRVIVPRHLVPLAAVARQSPSRR